MGRTFILVTMAACATPEQRAQRQAYFQSHPMAECREMIRQADINQGWRDVSDTMSGQRQPRQQIDPCSLGCRIPACGYPPAPAELAR